MNDTICVDAKNVTPTVGVDKNLKNISGLFGAGGGNRTPTPFQALDFESSTSTSSITPARVLLRCVPPDVQVIRLGRARIIHETSWFINYNARLYF